MEVVNIDLEICIACWQAISVLKHIEHLVVVKLKQISSYLAHLYYNEFIYIMNTIAASYGSRCTIKLEQTCRFCKYHMSSIIIKNPVAMLLSFKEVGQSCTWLLVSILLLSSDITYSIEKRYY